MATHLIEVFLVDQTGELSYTHKKDTVIQASGGRSFHVSKDDTVVWLSTDDKFAVHFKGNRQAAHHALPHSPLHLLLAPE